MDVVMVLLCLKIFLLPGDVVILGPNQGLYLFGTPSPEAVEVYVVKVSGDSMVLSNGAAINCETENNDFTITNKRVEPVVTDEAQKVIDYYTRLRAEFETRQLARTEQAIDYLNCL